MNNLSIYTFIAFSHSHDLPHWHIWERAKYEHKVWPTIEIKRKEKEPTTTAPEQQSETDETENGDPIESEDPVDTYVGLDGVIYVPTDQYYNDHNLLTLEDQMWEEVRTNDENDDGRKQTDEPGWPQKPKKRETSKPQKTKQNPKFSVVD